jgi:hypothetical protein
MPDRIGINNYNLQILADNPRNAVFTRHPPSLSLISIWNLKSRLQRFFCKPKNNPMKANFILFAVLWFVPAEPEPSVKTERASLPIIGDNENQAYQILEGWHIKKNSKGIQVSIRWILTPGKAKTRQVRGAMILQAKKEQLIRLITNENCAREWMVFLDELHYYQELSKPKEWFSYGRINILGKLACFDVVTNNHVLRENADNQTVIVMNDAPGYIPDKSGVHRITGLNVSWVLTAIAENQTRVEYMLYTDMKPVVPVWVTEPIISSMMINTMDQFREKSREVSMLSEY